MALQKDAHILYLFLFLAITTLGMGNRLNHFEIGALGNTEIKIMMN